MVKNHSDNRKVTNYCHFIDFFQFIAIVRDNDKIKTRYK